MQWGLRMKTLTRHPNPLPLPLFLLVGAVAALVGERGAVAATTTGTFGVTANVTVNCTVTGTTLAFGAYNPTSAIPLDGSSVLTVTCTKGAVVSSVQLSMGANGTGSQRRMAAGTTDMLTYELYTDKPGGVVWTMSTTGNGFTSAGPSTPNLLTVFGRIPIGQNVPVGAYTDTVTATVNF
jgi:spore coat protein U-like protein